MVKLKGEELINEAFNAWLEKYGFSARIREMDTDAWWYSDTDTISYSLFYPLNAVPVWYELLAELGLRYEIDLFWTVFLHELGHSETTPWLPTEDLEESECTKAWLDEVDESSFADPADINRIYYRLPVEIEATRWAVDYINNNPEAVKELADTVGAALDNFYRVNNIEG